MVLRHGDRGIVYGNFFLNGKGGVRVKEGRGHAIFNNYFQGLKDRSIFIQNAKADPVKDVIIAHNTFVNTAKVRLNGNANEKPKGIKVYNNLFSNEGTSVISHTTGLEDFKGNLFKGKLDAKKAVKGFVSTKPLLEKNEFGLYQISYKSPVINSSEAGYLFIPSPDGMVVDANILLDISKNPRPTQEDKKDVGCSEFFISTKLKPHADKKNTGPSYLVKTKQPAKKVNKAPVAAKPKAKIPSKTKDVSPAAVKKPEVVVPKVSTKAVSEKVPVSTDSVKKEVVDPVVKGAGEKNINSTTVKKPEVVTPKVSTKAVSEKVSTSTDQVKKEVVAPAINNIESKKSEILNQKVKPDTTATGL